MTAYHDTEAALEATTIDGLAEPGWGRHVTLYEGSDSVEGRAQASTGASTAL